MRTWPKPKGLAMNRREALTLLPSVWALAFGARCVAGSPPIRRSKPWIDGPERVSPEEALAAQEGEEHFARLVGERDGTRYYQPAQGYRLILCQDGQIAVRKHVESQ